MSHFTVVVVGEDIEGQLAPFDENLEVDPYVVNEDHTSSLEKALNYFIKEAGEPFEESIIIENGWKRGGHDPSEYQKILDRREEIKTNVSEQHADLWFLNQYEGYDAWVIQDGKLVEVSTLNPHGHWDWYQIGGRWNGFFDLRPEEEPLAPVEPHYSEIEAEQRWRTSYEDHVMMCLKMEREALSREEWDEQQLKNRAPYATREDFMRAKRGTGDQVLKRQIDWDFAREKARIKAEEKYDAFATAVEGIDPGPSWEALLESKLEAEGPDRPRQEIIDEAREEHHAHPFQLATKKLFDFYWGSVHKDYFVGIVGARDKFIQKAVDAVFVPYAVVINGEWIAQGTMGWFGMSDDKESDDQWAKQVRQMYDSLPDDTQLTLVDCHV